MNETLQYQQKPIVNIAGITTNQYINTFRQATSIKKKYRLELWFSLVLIRQSVISLMPWWRL